MRDRSRRADTERMRLIAGFPAQGLIKPFYPGENRIVTLFLLGGNALTENDFGILIQNGTFDFGAPQINAETVGCRFQVTSCKFQV